MIFIANFKKSEKSVGISCNGCTGIFALVYLQSLGPLPKSYPSSNCGFNFTYKCFVLRFDKTVMATTAGISSLKKEGMADSLNLKHG